MILQLIILIIIFWSLFSLIRRQYFTSAFLFVLMSSRGLCIVPESDSGIRLTYGTFIYIILFILLHKKYIHKFYNNYKLNKPIIIFILFIISSIFFSILYYGFPIISSITIGVKYFVVLSLFVFCLLNHHDYQKLIRILFYITFITSILYCLQCVTGLQLLAYTLEAHETPTSNGLYRFYNSPPLIQYYLCISLFYTEIIPKKCRLIAPIVFMLAILLSNGRTAIITSFITILIINFILGKFKRQIKIYVLLGILILALYPLMSQRMDNDGKTFSDIEYILKGDIFAGDYQSKDGMTMLYRFAWVYERWLYLKNEPFPEILFGLGMVHDGMPEVNQRYHFLYGLINKETGNVFQVRTPDIAWGNYLTCYGILGSILYFLIIFRIIGITYEKRKQNTIATILYSIILVSFINSFSGTVSLFFNYIIKNERKKEIISYHSML